MTLKNYFLINFFATLLEFKLKPYNVFIYIRKDPEESG